MTAGIGVCSRDSKSDRERHYSRVPCDSRENKFLNCPENTGSRSPMYRAKHRRRTVSSQGCKWVAGGRPQPKVYEVEIFKEGGVKRVRILSPAAKERKRQRAHDYYISQPAWKKAEKLIQVRLRKKGVRSTLVSSYQSAFDLTTAGGQNIEVKYANYNPDDRSWTVSIARNGKMTERDVTAYVFVLKGHPATGLKQKPIYVVMRSPLRKRNIRITVRRLIGDLHPYYENWRFITEAERRREAKAARATAKTERSAA